MPILYPFFWGRCQIMSAIVNRESDRSIRFSISSSPAKMKGALFTFYWKGICGVNPLAKHGLQESINLRTQEIQLESFFGSKFSWIFATFSSIAADRNYYNVLTQLIQPAIHHS